MVVNVASARPGRGRLTLFAFGDFAFNLYWQTVMMFLLFYYTEALNLPIAVASGIYLIASVWDGIANFVAGILVDRRQGSLNFGRLLAIGSIPLGLSFVLAYVPPLFPGAAGIALVLIAHMAFRTAYAGLNVPYLAMSARISPDTRDRSFVAGLRMMFGTAAAVTVALGTITFGSAILGPGNAKPFLGAAIVFAVLGAAILCAVGLLSRIILSGSIPASAR